MMYQKREPRFSRDTGPVFGIGRRLYVHCADRRDLRAPLADDKESAVVGVLDDGDEVEIIGWLPRGVATRYFVRAIRRDVSGWLGRGQLRDTAVIVTEVPSASPIAATWIPVTRPGPKRIDAGGRTPADPVAPEQKSKKRSTTATAVRAKARS